MTLQPGYDPVVAAPGALGSPQIILPGVHLCITHVTVTDWSPSRVSIFPVSSPHPPSALTFPRSPASDWPRPRSRPLIGGAVTVGGGGKADTRKGVAASDREPHLVTRLEQLDK